MNKLNASDEFVKGKHSIGYVDSSFRSFAEGKEFDEVVGIPVFRTLTESMNDAMIESKLQPGICALGDVLKFLDMAPDECKDGKWNLFYFPDFVVSVRWSASVWRVSAWYRDVSGWLAGRRVFSPATGLTATKAMTLQLEEWKSSANRKEQHYFIEGGDKGYQHNTYVFGFNPELIDESTADILLTIVKAKLKL